MLRRQGYRIMGVTDGGEAVSRTISEQPVAVLLDLRMPGTTGAEALAQLKGNEQTRHIPVIVVSGLSPEAEPLVQPEADEWLIKPVTEERLVQTVATTLAHREQHGRVLLVEDDEDLAGVIATLLGGHGLEVSHATTAADAILVGNEVAPDVIVLDLHLPDGDGSAVVSEFRRTRALSRTPLVVYSAADVEESRRGELRLGETVFLTKGRSGPEAVENRVLQLVNVITRRPVVGDDLD
jgi:CheY-like chemotaxis protein